MSDKDRKIFGKYMVSDFDNYCYSPNYNYVVGMAIFHFVITFIQLFSTPFIFVLPFFIMVLIMIVWGIIIAIWRNKFPKANMLFMGINSTLLFVNIYISARGIYSKYYTLSMFTEMAVIAGLLVVLFFCVEINSTLLGCMQTKNENAESN